MIVGKKGLQMMIGKLIKIIIIIFVLVVIFYFLKQVSEAGNTFLGMFD